MTEITLKIPENKLRFFMELVKQLGIEISSETAIPDSHKDVVRARLKTAKAEEMVPWQDARKQFKSKITAYIPFPSENTADLDARTDSPLLRACRN